jgi:2-iminobutanoate/2-iminopropanoate deaminase
MKYISTEKAPKAVGPYSQAIVSNGFVFCSGQIGLDPKTNELVDGLEAQVHQVLKNLTEVLKAGGSSLESVVKTTIFVRDMNTYAKVNEIYGSYFPDHKPARATVEVSYLPKDALIEIEVVAEVKE